MGLQLIIPPAREVLALDIVKSHLRVDVDDDDMLIASLITAAREYCETFQCRAYLTQTWELWLDQFPYESYIRVPLPPLQSVSSVKYYDTDDTEYILSPDDYFVDIKSEPGRIALNYGKSWPSITLRQVNAVCVCFTAGYKSYTGVVSTDGAAVTRLSGDEFSTGWPSGKLIVINNVTYRIASVTSKDALTLATTASTQTGVMYAANDVPIKAIQSIMLLAAHFYENREAVLIGSNSKEIEFAVKALLWQDRVVTI